MRKLRSNAERRVLESGGVPFHEGGTHRRVASATSWPTKSGETGNAAPDERA